MLLADSLVVVGMAVASLGSIQEATGIQQRTFVLRNKGSQAVAMTRGYTSCGCTTIHFPKGKTLQPRDTAHVTLRFNPRGKGGEFYESGTVEYGRQRRLTVAMKGECITSEETLMRQFPIRVNDHLRLSSNRFDLGVMRAGDVKERHVTLLHQDENNRRETLKVVLTVDKSMPKGLQHVQRAVVTRDVNGKPLKVIVTFDVMIK